MTELEARIAALPLWQGTPKSSRWWAASPTSASSVTDAAGKYVARIGADYPFHHVSRERELMTARAAHAAGFAPEIVHAEPGLMVSRFIEGKVFGAADVRANIGRIAELVRRFHDEMPAAVTGPGFIFWVFHVIRDYAHTLAASQQPAGRAAARAARRSTTSSRRRRCRSRSSSATTTCCPPTSSTTASGSG